MELSRGKYRYEIKVDSNHTEQLSSKVDLEFSSKIKGFEKFVTSYLKDKIFEAEHLEDQ